MKKEEKSYFALGKPRSIYRYQLKATNEILKDTLDFCHSSVLSTAHTNRNAYPPLQDNDLTFFHETAFNRLPPQSSRPLSCQMVKKQLCSGDISYSKSPAKHQFEEYQHGKSSFHGEFQGRSKKEKHQDWDYLAGQPIIYSDLYSFSSENGSFYQNNIEQSQCRSKPASVRKNASNDIKKDLKRQRRGLADISLKVKNIVAKMGKMTFKQVSDEVLKQSQEDLPNAKEERQKQQKNIRRRVYDALNVLVSVGILGKLSRCVILTEFTNVRGKKLSEHYDIVAERIKSLEQQKRTFKKKLDNLNLLKKNYQTLLLFHQRNRMYNNLPQKREEHTRGYVVEQFNRNMDSDRIYFPLIFLLPPKVMTQKIRIQIQYNDRNAEFIRKFQIEGTDYILTDLDTLKYLSLPRQLKPQEAGLKEQILEVRIRRRKGNNRLAKQNFWIDYRSIGKPMMRFICPIDSRARSSLDDITKKSSIGQRDNSIRRRCIKSVENLKSYGPPPLQEIPINSDIGYKLKMMPTGLKRKVKKIFVARQERQMSTAYMSTKIGESNLLKRFSRLSYLENWNSKKSMYNVWEQKLISRLSADLFRAKRRQKM